MSNNNYYYYYYHYHCCNNKKNNNNNNNRYNDSYYSYNKINRSGKRSPVDKDKNQIVGTKPAMNTKIAPIFRQKFPQAGQ